MEGKRGSARALRAALAALLMIALALTLTACGGKRIDASSLISVRFQGLNGDGRAVLAFDRDKLIAALSQDKALTERQMETLERLDVTNAKVTVVDKGALDCTIKARVECAVYRSNDVKDKLPWGGAIR